MPPTRAPLRHRRTTVHSTLLTLHRRDTRIRRRRRTLPSRTLGRRPRRHTMCDRVPPLRPLIFTRRHRTIRQTTSRRHRSHR